MSRRTITEFYRTAQLLAARTRTHSVIIWSAITFGYTAADLIVMTELAVVSIAALGLILLYLQLFLTSSALAQLDVGYTFEPHRPTKGRFLSAFAVSLVWLIGIAFGLVLLVIPGVVLFVRWSLSSPILLAEDVSAMASLRRSWELTRNDLRLTVVFAVTTFIVWMPACAALLQYPDEDRPSTGLSLAANTLFATASVATWLMACALYSILKSRQRDLAA